MRDPSKFLLTFESWKSGNNYWDARGISAPGYEEGKDDYLYTYSGTKHIDPSSDGKRVDYEVTIPETLVTADYPYYSSNNPNYRSSFDPNGAEIFLDATGVGTIYNPFRYTREISNFLSNPKLAIVGALESSIPFSAPGRALYGAYLLASDNGVRKTYDLLSSGQYGKAALSGLGDVFNAAMLGEGSRTSLNNLKDKLRIVNNLNGKYIRTVGEDAIKDAEESGVIRSNRPDADIKNESKSGRRFLLKKEFTYPMFSKDTPWEELGGSLGDVVGKKVYITNKEAYPDNIIWESSTNGDFSHKGHKGIYRPVYNEDINAAPVRNFEYYKKLPFNLGYRLYDFNHNNTLDESYINAVNSGNMQEALRLRDLHFKQNAPNSKYYGHLYRGVMNDNPIMDLSKMEVVDVPGVYTTPIKKYAERYGDNLFDLYGNIENPWIDTLNERYSTLSFKTLKHFIEKYKDNGNIDKYNKFLNIYNKIKNTDSAYRYLGNTPSDFDNSKLPPEIIIRDPNKVKLSNAVTYDNEGKIIPLSKRDNWSSPDIRYGLIPIGIGLGLYNLNKNLSTNMNINPLYKDGKDMLPGFNIGTNGTKIRRPRVLSELYVYKRLKNYGVTNPYVAAAITANAGIESEYNSDSVQASGAHKGLWLLQPGYVDYVVKHYGGYGPEQQIKFAADIANGTLPETKSTVGRWLNTGVSKKFRSQLYKTAADASTGFQRYFEGAMGQKDKARRDVAERIYKQYLWDENMNTLNKMIQLNSIQPADNTRVATPAISKPIFNISTPLISPIMLNPILTQSIYPTQYPQQYVPSIMLLPTVTQTMYNLYNDLPLLQIPQFDNVDGFARGKDKGIHIAKSKEGTFTRAAKIHGMGVQAFANKVLSAPKGKYSSAMRKKSNFARNAGKWNH